MKIHKRGSITASIMILLPHFTNQICFNSTKIDLPLESSLIKKMDKNRKKRVIEYEQLDTRCALQDGKKRVPSGRLGRSQEEKGRKERLNMKRMN